MTVHGRDLDVDGLLDLLWLARVVGAGQPATPPAPPVPADPPPSDPDPGDGDATPATPRVTGSPPVPREATVAAVSPDDPGGWITAAATGVPAADRPESAAPDAGASPISSPWTSGANASIPGLRPLRRKVPRPGGATLDAELSTRASADAGHLVVVTRDVDERWLDLALVIDVSPTMGMWRREVARIRRAVRRSGVFRDVRFWRLSRGDDGTMVLRSPSGQRHRPSELLDHSGRRLIALVTDAVDDCWRETGSAAMLSRWAARNPVVVLQVLPASMWHLTALPPVRRRTGEPGPAVGGPGGAQRSDWIPVVATDTASIHRWASALAERRLHRAALPTVPVRFLPLSDAYLPVPPSRVAPAQQVADFQSLCSAQAFELAGHLAAAPVTLPLARTVQDLFVRGSQPFHLAEVLLSGLLERIKPPPTPDEDPDTVIYDFTPGVREELLRTLTRSRAFAILDALADRSGSIAGPVGTTDLYALADDPGLFLDRFPDSRVAASTAVAVLGALGGPYAEAADRLTVALHPTPDPDEPATPPDQTRPRPAPPPQQMPMFQYTAAFTMSRNNEMPYAGVAVLTRTETDISGLYGKRQVPQATLQLIGEEEPITRSFLSRQRHAGI